MNAPRRPCTRRPIAIELPTSTTTPEHAPPAAIEPTRRQSRNRGIEPVVARGGRRASRCDQADLFSSRRDRVRLPPEADGMFPRDAYSSTTR